jgi:ferritin-like metal-binding protein YciE
MTKDNNFKSNDSFVNVLMAQSTLEKASKDPEKVKNNLDAFKIVCNSLNKSTIKDHLLNSLKYENVEFIKALLPKLYENIAIPKRTAAKTKAKIESTYAEPFIKVLEKLLYSKDEILIKQTLAMIPNDIINNSHESSLLRQAIKLKNSVFIKQLWKKLQEKGGTSECHFNAYLTDIFNLNNPAQKENLTSQNCEFIIKCLSSNIIPLSYLMQKSALKGSLVYQVLTNKDAPLATSLLSSYINLRKNLEENLSKEPLARMKLTNQISSYVKEIIKSTFEQKINKYTVEEIKSYISKLSLDNGAVNAEYNALLQQCEKEMLSKAKEINDELHVFESHIIMSICPEFYEIIKYNTLLKAAQEQGNQNAQWSLVKPLFIATHNPLELIGYQVGDNEFKGEVYGQGEILKKFIAKLNADIPQNSEDILRILAPKAFELFKDHYFKVRDTLSLDEKNKVDVFLRNSYAVEVKLDNELIDGPESWGQYQTDVTEHGKLDKGSVSKPKSKNKQKLQKNKSEDSKALPKDSSLSSDDSMDVSESSIDAMDTSDDSNGHSDVDSNHPLSEMGANGLSFDS